MEKKTIGITNGCFDIFHLGHIHFLKSCKKYCEKLIVCLNNDKSISFLKGNKRPVNPLYYRKSFLECIKYVDKVLIFRNDKHLFRIIKKIKPQFYFKDNTYIKKKLNNYNLLKKIKAKIILIRRIKKYSTTKIINKYYKKSI